ncbi:MAG: integral membrane sensor signal transduction histidine kinase [Parcubacteria group bacterium Gr01-1014_18]|nr:MAG: integral membrane sensor signal transduction histidine kinase [Parcubacteria group bacterium Greene0416_36]TSC80946.1 MAG: integral membrane sensor signal transduction histidine kinase [Parcubacteria group bacterium Gr01-1014_18]TSC98711.1 MAG: integral membrane sensor signal transduction histidine kinase [Parcubacteria group bacterium Greene1014_20]TSD06463.1 MAG: integral membrane sensor signal transduction histidine kinase [Parcubacteria group bacterium Greene0714_2]
MPEGKKTSIFELLDPKVILGTFLFGFIVLELTVLMGVFIIAGGFWGAWKMILLFFVSSIFLYVMWVGSYIQRQVRAYTRFYEEKSANVERRNTLLEQKTEKQEAELATCRADVKVKSKLVEYTSTRMLTPLKTLKMDMEMLLGGQLGKVEDSQAVFLRLLHRKNVQIISSMEDILLVDEIQSGRWQLVMEQSNIEILLDVNLEEVKGLLNSKNLAIKRSRKGGMIPDFPMDSYKMKKAILKLISQAITFSKDNGEITILLENKPESVVLSVGDAGTGLSSTDVERIFSPFFSAGNISLAHPEASGLNLFIVEKIVEAHGGQIRFSSELGKGSTVTVVFPKIRN